MRYALVALIFATTGGPLDPLLGSRLRQDGYSLRPPLAFRMARMDLFRGTRTGAVGPGIRNSRWLSAALVDGDGDDAATMLIALVEGSFQVSPAARDEFSTAVVRHYSEELGLKFAMERAELVPGAPARIEVLGTVRLENQVRRVLVAAFDGLGRHAVLTFTAPTGRWDALVSTVKSSMESFRNDLPVSTGPSRGLVGAVAVGFAIALSMSLWVWKRRVARSPGTAR